MTDREREIVSALIARIEALDNPSDMGIGRDDDCVIAARGLLTPPAGS